MIGVFFQCQKNAEAGQDVVRCISAYHRRLDKARTLRLELVADYPFLLANATILAISLEFIWENRRQKKTTSLFLMRS
jgi:hypothetical protein